MGVLLLLSLIGLPICLIIFLVQLFRKKQSKKLWGILTIVFAVLLCISFTFGGNDSEDTTAPEEATSQEQEVSSDQDAAKEDTQEASTVFSKDNLKLLSSLGLTDVHDEDVVENGNSTIVRAKIFDSDDLQLNVTLESDEIIYVQLTGIVEDNDVVSNRTDKLKLDVGLQGQSAVDLYTDTDGVLAVLNWDDKTIMKK